MARTRELTGVRLDQVLQSLRPVTFGQKDRLFTTPNVEKTPHVAKTHGTVCRRFFHPVLGLGCSDYVRQERGNSDAPTDVPIFQYLGLDSSVRDGLLRM